MGRPCDSHETSMGSLWDAHGILVGLSWVSHGSSMGHPRNAPERRTKVPIDYAINVHRYQL